MAVRKKKASASPAPKGNSSQGARAASPKTHVAATPEDIAARAYALWEASGRRHGNDRAHWFQAERELAG